MKNRCYRLLDKFGIDNLKMVTETIPDVPPPGHVLVKSHAVSLNYRDILMLDGEYDPRVSLGFIPCSDMAGEIIAVGQNVNELEVGDMVNSCFYQWPEPSGLEEKIRFTHTLGGTMDGVLCEYKIFPHWGITKYSNHLTPQEASTVPCAGVVTWHALFDDHRPLAAGDTVVMIGSGGVSSYVIQLAKAAGAITIVVSRSKNKEEKLKSLGVDHVINSVEHPEWSKKIVEITGRGADRIIETGGSGTLEQSIYATRANGIIYLIGVVAEPGILSDKTIKRMLMYGVTVKGLLVGHRSLQLKLNRCMSNNKIKPIIDKTFDFENANKAFEYLRSGNHLGKITINI